MRIGWSQGPASLGAPIGSVPRRGRHCEGWLPWQSPPDQMLTHSEDASAEPPSEWTASILEAIATRPTGSEPTADTKARRSQ